LVSDFRVGFLGLFGIVKIKQYGGRTFKEELRRPVTGGEPFSVKESI